MNSGTDFPSRAADLHRNSFVTDAHFDLLPFVVEKREGEERHGSSSGSTFPASGRGGPGGPQSANFSGRGSVAGHTVNSPSPGAKRSRFALFAERSLGEGA